MTIGRDGNAIASTYITIIAIDARSIRTRVGLLMVILSPFFPVPMWSPLPEGASILDSVERFHLLKV
jgi:hypothetical protein